MIDVLQPDAAGAAEPTLLTFLWPRRPTVLLADSDEQASAKLVLLLAALGFHAIEARDATDAIAHVNEEPAIDILLAADTVAGMPVAELVEAVQNLSPRLEHLVMSDKVQVAGIAPGHVLQRPFDGTTLKEALDRLLRGSEGAEDSSLLQ